MKLKQDKNSSGCLFIQYSDTIDER